jgi:type IV pilus assembly protein PilY1
MRCMRIPGTASWVLFAACHMYVHMYAHAHAATPPDAVLPYEPLASPAPSADANVVLDLALALSSAGAAYRGDFDWTVSHAGQWDPMGCYAYAAADGYFRREATAKKGAGGEIACNHQWSGNLLNWAATSAVDGVRLALTGGHRVVDEPGRTVLQRAALPADFYRSVHFPDKVLRGRLDQLTPLVAQGTGLQAGDAIHFNSCGDHLFAGPSATGSCAEPGSDRRYGAYLARVAVCTPEDAAARRQLCLKYPSGHHKPVGAIQRNSQGMRFAVFGHPVGGTSPGRGSVLLAPMKHVGPRKTDAALDLVNNPDAEWDALTGVFKTVPDATGGVVDAIHRLGHGGEYSLADPAGDLFYASLRYLQGQPAGRGVADPVTAGCQRNHIVTVGDARTHADRSLPGMSKGVSAAGFDAALWTRLVGAFENREALSYVHPSGKAGLTTGNSGPPAFSDQGGAQLTSASITTAGPFGIAGLAYWANTQKIRADHPDLRVRTWVVDMTQGEARNQGAGREPRGSARYLAAKYGGFVDSNDDGNPFRASGGIDRPDVNGNAEWAEGVDADGQPQPRTYFPADHPARMAAAMRRVFERAGIPPARGMVDGAVSSDVLSTAGASLYVTGAGGERGAGTLLSYPLGFDAASGTVRKGERPDWDAGALLTGNASASPPQAARDPSSRRIFTLSATGGVPFVWNALDETLRAHLGTAPDAQPAAPDALGPDRLAYLRGDRRKELSVPGGVFRVRDSVIGDIAHATPLSVDGRGGRTPAVYVGANDGMFHAFSARTGDELFAYVPRTLFPRLAAYASPDAPRQSLADGIAAVGDIQLAVGARRSVLVSGLGAGGTGVFALDVTRPEAFSEQQVMWEFSRADDADMGHLTQAPRILRFRTAAAVRTSAASHRWFAVVPSGFNNANPEKRAALFLLALDKPAGAAWVRDVNYHKILLPAPADGTVANALSVPGDYAGADGSTRLLYAGDTQGNLWKFDFSRNAPWNEGNALSFSGQPLMVALGEGGRRQPITVQPEVGIGPAGGAIVLFGTGKFVGPEDVGRSNHVLQTVYGVYDNGSMVPAHAARTQLQPRRAVAAIGAGAASASIAGDLFVHGVFDEKTSTRRGWYLDLPASRDRGERVVARPVLNDGLLFFNTLIPGEGACGKVTGRSCAVDALTGLSRGGTCVPADNGVAGIPQVVQLGDGVLGASDAFGRRTSTRRLSVINLGGRSGKGGPPLAQPVDGSRVPRVAGRLNWRQVVDHRGAKP